MFVVRLIAICTILLLSGWVVIYLITSYHTEYFTVFGNREQETTKSYNSSELQSCSIMDNTTIRNFTTSDIMTNFRRCSLPHWKRFEGDPEQAVLNWPFMIYVCDKEDPINRIPLMPFSTMNKTYWAVSPQCIDEKSVLVTLGIKNDTLAVKMLRDAFPGLVTYGTNAWLKSNEDYDHFHNYAIGVNGSGIRTVYGTNGEIEKLEETSVTDFFESFIGEKMIDMLWINLDGGEFEYWKYIGKFTEFNRLKITVCQINLEIPQGDALHFEVLLNNLYQHRTYIFMRPMMTKKMTISTYLINVEDLNCFRKYLK